MPDATEETIEKLEQNLKNVSSVTSLFEEGKTPDDILAILLNGIDYHVNDTVPTRYKCDCSRERVERALVSIGADELKKIIDEDGKAELSCQFCSKKYNFTKDELEKLLAEMKNQ